MGKNIFLVSDRGLTELGLLDPTIKKLKKIVILKYLMMLNPSKKTLLNAFSDAREFESTGVLGFGGGSSMDVAKLVSLLLGSNQQIETIWGVNNAKVQGYHLYSFLQQQELIRSYTNFNNYDG